MPVGRAARPVPTGVVRSLAYITRVRRTPRARAIDQPEKGSFGVDKDEALRRAAQVERGEAPSGSVVVRVTGPNSLHTHGPGARTTHRYRSRPAPRVTPARLRTPHAASAGAWNRPPSTSPACQSRRGRPGLPTNANRFTALRR